ncbi:bifunctional RNase H/acid phosphatase [Plantactinospora sp. S1510]|uniref:Bifunctional RNase H/acid phosphatase n=1 Tax=Plantactinospora alkalitolerans TaxID=2789879 RepID=A0ABS0GPN5_9ACTN|nr:bifunctional RNase H/acid phosphatase [Plantactinospora alkalitolerans]MBF9128167.1 bifunctional RNase H/acid phosphatase [Plantactinospora alkalitolerans]
MPGRRVVVEADGGARGNPGPAGYGAVVRDAGTGEVLAERSESIGVATNNVAEYRGLIAGLEAAREAGATGVEVRMDSKLVVEQMAGRWQIKNAGLRPLAAQAAGLVRRFDAVSYTWIPRERNRHADALANAAMDLAAGKVPGIDRDSAAAGRAAEPDGAGAPADPTGRARTHEAAAQGSTAKSSWEPRPSDTATRLLLLRHGETEYTQRGRYSGRGDVPLSDRGLAQAGAAARRVAGLVSSVAAVVSSPLSRCTSMAGIIAGGLGGVPLVVEPDLIECDFGEWEGRTFAEVRERWPAELDAWLASPAVAPPGGESFVEVTARVNRATAKLLASYPGETVVVVSHVSPVKIALRDALAATDAFLHRLYLDPAGLSLMDIWPDGGMAVRTVNDTAHLAGI